MPGRTVYENLHLGSQSEEVTDLQQTLVKWMPAWKNRLKADGFYGEQTAKALGTFKEVYGLGRDGKSIDPRTAFALRDISSGEFWRVQPDTNALPYHMAPDKGALYNLAVHGYPFDEVTRLPELKDLAGKRPDEMISYQDYPLQARAAYPLARLERDMRKEGYGLQVTCTTSGEHLSWQHPAGRAADFAITWKGQYIDDLGASAMAHHSERVAALAERNGLAAVNEYLIKTPYGNGVHLHVQV